MRRFLIVGILFLLPLYMCAEEDAFMHLLTNYQILGGKTEIMDKTDKYVRVSLSDSAYVEMYIADNLIVVYTVCAPVCSSCAHVYNKEWELLFPIEPPFPSVFPLATMDKETGRIVWKDNDKWEY